MSKKPNQSKHMRVEQKVHERSFLFVGLWVYIMFTYIRVYSVQCLCLEACFEEGEDGYGNQKHIDFCSSHDIGALGILWIKNLSRKMHFVKNIE